MILGGIRTNFLPWYPLGNLPTLPSSAGVFQVKVKGHLFSYPKGQSAMVYYGRGPNLREAIEEIASKYQDQRLCCRHQEHENYEGLYALVSTQFMQRFQQMPSWPIDFASNI